MANLINFGTFYPRRLSEYVPAMQYSADLQLNNNTRVSFGTPVTGGNTDLLVGQSIATAGTLQGTGLSKNATLDAIFGRTLNVVLSAAGSGTIIVDGWDYLNQPMSESASFNGTTNVAMKKAFKIIRQITWTAVAGATLSMGSGSTLGLPYKAIKVYTEELNGVPTAIGTLTNPDVTFPATLTTGDPRGTYTPFNVTNTTGIITATLDFANDVDANNNGGLMGMPHYTN